MKLGPTSYGFPSIVIALLSFFIASAPSTSRASPRRSISQEDALADGDVDAEDVALRSPLTTISSATSGRGVLGRPSGSTYLSLVGFTRTTLEDRREVGGFVILGLPLDSFARSNTRATTPTLAREERAQGVAVTMPELTPASVVSSLGTANVPEQPFELALTPRLARSCVAAAWRAAGLGVDDSRLEAIVSRARWSSVLPEARLRAVRFEDARLSFDTGTDTSRLRDSAGANVGFEARLTWRFDRLIYADDEPSFERIRLEHRDARARIAAKVLEALFHWQRAALDLRTLPPTQEGTRDEADVVLRVMEAEAALDVLTNGAFAVYRKERQIFDEGSYARRRRM